MREGLKALGLDSDTILHHATPRLFYACELGGGARRRFGNSVTTYTLSAWTAVRRTTNVCKRTLPR